MKREPSLYIGFVATILTLAATFGMPFLSAHQAAIIIVVLNAALGAWTALKVRPVPPAAFTYLVASVATLLSAYGFDLTQEQTGAINAAALGLLTFILRGNVAPVDGLTAASVRSRVG